MENTKDKKYRIGGVIRCPIYPHPKQARMSHVAWWVSLATYRTEVSPLIHLPRALLPFRLVVPSPYPSRSIPSSSKCQAKKHQYLYKEERQEHRSGPLSQGNMV